MAHDNVGSKCKRGACSTFARAITKVRGNVDSVDESPTKESRSGEDAVTMAEAIADWPITPANILSQCPLSVVTADLQGRITCCNLAAEKMYGYTPEELIGRPLSILLVEQEKSVLDNILQNGHFQGEIQQQTRAEKAIDAFISLTVLRDQQAQPCGFLQVSIDLSGQASSSRELTNAEPDQEDAKSGPGSRPVVVERNIGGTPFIIASLLMHKFLGLVDRVASHTETVLITGGTGTGKELVARTIHQSSFRASKQFVEINCAALPEHLVESELFGYEKGAFSGADSAKAGLFELADKGTLFLDEIGELPLHMQVKLLRVLDGSSYYRLGGHRQVKVDVRVVAATNQDLDAAVKDGRFRRDLFHRLTQFHLRVPPLRERPEDIAVLARHFLRAKTPDKRFSEEAVRVLQAHQWPGNIRELRNVVTKLAIDSPADEISADQARGEISHEEAQQAPSSAETIALPGDLGMMEEQMIVKALERTHGHRALAAEQLGISRRTLSRKLREYQINAPGRAKNNSLGAISWEQQKSYRAKVRFPVRLKTTDGEELQLTAINLSSRGIGVEGLTRTAQCEGVLEVSFELPGEDLHVLAKARIVWAEAEGRAGVQFISMESDTVAKLQHWANRKMREEGWELSQ